MLDTFSGQSLRSTSGRIGVNVETAFNMRHRLMCVLEKVLDDEVLFGKVELDETYVDSSRKDVGCGRDAGFGTVVQKVKRGLSRQKVCILGWKRLRQGIQLRHSQPGQRHGACLPPCR